MVEINIMKYIILYLYAIILFACPLQAGTILDSVPDTEYIKYGENIDCVVEMLGISDKKISSQFSGVVIHPNWIITAAHTLNNKEQFYFRYKKQTIPIDEYYIHPDYNRDKFGSIDIGLCYVKNAIKINFIPELYQKSEEIDKIVCIVGYGMTGTGSTGAIKWDGKKRAGSNFIDKIENSLLICSMSRPSEKSTSLEICIVSGDSGGGLFIDKKLAGINSCVIHKDRSHRGKYGDESGHVRLSSKKCLDWIKYIIYE